MESKIFDDISDKKLINLVRLSPIIYQFNPKNQKDHATKESAWSAIAKSLGKNVTDCKTRWRTIRDSYRKNQKKLKNNNSPAAGVPKSKYNDERLKFLDKSFKRRGPARSKAKPAIKVEIIEDNDDLEEEEARIAERPGNKTAKRRRISEPQTIEEEEEESSSKIRSNELIEELNIGGSEEPIETFFKSMARTVMTFPPCMIAETRMKVCKIISEMEIRSLQQQSSAVGTAERYSSSNSSLISTP